MKLMIDVTDEEYKLLSEMSEQEKANELSYYERIIANGTPITDDCISREALKKAVEEVYDDTLDGIVKYGIEKAYNTIDSVPTIGKEND